MRPAGPGLSKPGRAYVQPRRSSGKGAARRQTRNSSRHWRSGGSRARPCTSARAKRSLPRAPRQLVLERAGEVVRLDREAGVEVEAVGVDALGAGRRGEVKTLAPEGAGLVGEPGGGEAAGGGPAGVGGGGEGGGAGGTAR